MRKVTNPDEEMNLSLGTLRTGMSREGILVRERLGGLEEKGQAYPESPRTSDQELLRDRPY